MGIANTLALVRATLDKLRWTVPGVAKIAVTAPSHRPRGALGDISGFRVLGFRVLGFLGFRVLGF